MRFLTGEEKSGRPIKVGQYHPSRSFNSLICVIRRVKFLFSDIDECAIPELAGKCVDNAECCNLPAEYVCKCKQGFEGDGQVECRGKRKYTELWGNTGAYFLAVH